MALRRRFDKNAEFRAQYHSLGDMLDTVVWQRLHGVETTGTGEVLFICYGFRATDAKKLWQSIAWESFDLA